MLKNELIELIKAGQLNEVLEKLGDWFEQNHPDDELYTELIGIQALYTKIETEKRSNRLSTEEYHIYFSRTVYAVLHILKTCDENLMFATPDIEHELSALINKQKQELNAYIFDFLKNKGLDLREINKLTFNWLEAYDNLLQKIQKSLDNKSKGMIYKDLDTIDLKKNEAALLKELENESPALAGKYFIAGKFKNLLGKHTESAEYLEKAIVLDAQNTEFKNDLGLQYLFLGQYKKAKELFEEALKIDLADNGENKDLKIATRKSNIANVQMYLGDFNDSADIAQRVLAGLKTDNIDETKKRDLRITVLNTLGQALHKKGQFDEAIENYNKALELLKNVDNESESYRIINNLGQAALEKGDVDTALEKFNEALATFESLTREEYPYKGTIINNIGACYFRKQEFQQAIEHYQKALDINLAVYGDEKHHTTAVRFNNLANAFAKTGEYEKALTHLHQAIDIDLDALGENHPQIGYYYLNLGMMHKKNNTQEVGADYLKKALDILENNLTEDHPTLLRLKEEMS